MSVEVKNCWEYMKCSKEKRVNCPVFKYGYGDKCWIMIDSFTDGCQKPKEGCFICPWFKLKYKP